MPITNQHNLKSSLAAGKE